MKKLVFILLISLANLITVTAYGQLDSLMDIYVERFDSVGFAYFKPNTIQPGQPFQLYLQYRDDELNEIVLAKQWEDPQIGMQHYRYYQTFRDLKVEAAEYTEHAQGGYLVAANGKVADISFERNYIPFYDKADALEVLIADLQDQVDMFAWQNQEWEDDLKVDMEDEEATYYPQGELMWALDNYHDLGMLIPDEKYHLAWRFEILALEPFSHKAYYVDAESGSIIREEQLICTDGAADILTQGYKTIDTRWYGGLTAKHILWADGNGRDIHTKYYSGSPWGLVSNIKDADDVWGSAEQLGTTAHWMTRNAWDFYDDIYSRTGVTGTGSELRVKADASIQNAYYRHKGNKDYLVYGYLDSDYLAVVDVAGHEFTHGVDEHSSGLVYESESGALDESFADIFGLMAERYAEPSTWDWDMGEDAQTLRSIDDPGAFGQPDTYEGTNWVTVAGCTPSDNNDYCGVHTNSGVQNFWFFLLSQGGSGTNDNGEAYNITGIGIDDAALIAHWSQVNILQSGSQYADARAGAIFAADAIFGDCSTEEIQTTNAWAAVGVGALSNCPTAISDHTPFITPSIYPNPTKDKLNVRFTNGKERSYELYTLDGRLIKQIPNQTDSHLELDLSGFSNGVYMLRIFENSNVATYKVIVTK